MRLAEECDSAAAEVSGTAELRNRTEEELLKHKPLYSPIACSRYVVQLATEPIAAARL